LISNRHWLTTPLSPNQLWPGISRLRPQNSPNTKALRGKENVSN
jgi:hypothetical protein